MIRWIFILRFFIIWLTVHSENYPTARSSLGGRRSPRLYRFFVHPWTSIYHPSASCFQVFVNAAIVVVVITELVVKAIFHAAVVLGIAFKANDASVEGEFRDEFEAGEITELRHKFRSFDAKVFAIGG